MRTTRLAQSLLILSLLLAPFASAWAADPPYRSPMKEQCESELQKDKAWQAEMRQAVRPEVHQEDANILAKNKKHVVMAYGAIWGLTVVFVVLLWMRQRRLVGELAALEQRIAKAAAE